MRLNALHFSYVMDLDFANLVSEGAGSTIVFLKVARSALNNIKAQFGFL
jgi:hypothetical protein